MKRDSSPLYVEWAGLGRKRATRPAGQCKHCGTRVRPAKQRCWDCEIEHEAERKRVLNARRRAERVSP